MSDGGKGSRPRPYSVKYEDFSSNWDRIFGKNISIEHEPSRGDTRINNRGETETFSEGYWQSNVSDNK